MDIVKQPHDKYFRATFGRPAIAKDFLGAYLLKDLKSIIDMESLIPQKDSFLSKELREEFSDLLFRVSIKGRGNWKRWYSLLCISNPNLSPKCKRRYGPRRPI